MVFNPNTMLIVLLHPLSLLVFTFFKTHSGWPEYGQKTSRERVCNSTISMGEGGKNHIIFS